MAGVIEGYRQSDINFDLMMVSNTGKPAKQLPDALPYHRRIDRLICEGLIEIVTQRPEIGVCTYCYGLTDAGRAALTKI